MNEVETIGIYIACPQCQNEFNPKIHAFTSCSKCCLKFCGSLQNNCFIEYHRKSGCKGSFMTIFNPQWQVKLRVVK